MGFPKEDANQLRRISLTLRRWFERECGDSSQYASYCLVRGKMVGGQFVEDDAGRPYIERIDHATGEHHYFRTPDRENGAKKRLAAIMARFPGYTAYVQTDPRGCALYIGRNLTRSNYTEGVAVV